MGQVLGLCNVHLIGIQHDPDDAELWARFVGTQLTVKTTYQTRYGFRTGDRSNRETQEFIIAPDVIKRLRVGEFVASVKTQEIQGVIQIQMSPRYGSAAHDKTSQLMRGRSRTLAACKPVANKWHEFSEQSVTPSKTSGPAQIKLEKRGKL